MAKQKKQPRARVCFECRGTGQVTTYGGKGQCPRCKGRKLIH